MEEKKQKNKGTGRKVFGILMILVGICVCLYPFYRQKKSDNFNEDAINMILTPQPEKGEKEEKGQEIKEAAVTITPEGMPKGGVENSDTKQETQADMSVLGGDLVANPDAPETEEENANRLGGKTVIGVIQIPKIDLIYAIVEGSDAAEIGVAIGHMSNTAQIGAIGNCALAGHRGGYSGPYFKNLDKLEIGDEVVVTNAKQETFTYFVTETMIVQPDEVWVVEDTGEEVAMLTLVTCENSGTERLIVRCVME